MSDYIIGNKIGQGAYAVVHIGMHRKLNKKVALKIYEKEKIKDIQRKKSVRREIRLMKRLSHPNIAQLYEAIETEEQVILVLEYVPGGSTHGFLKSKPNRRMSEDDARRIYRQLINALQYLHGKCIAHRDIKLENVMLDERNQVKLIDFGFSTCIPNEQKIKIFCGTPSYMAPEIVRKTEFCGPPTDIYASGVLLFAFFCGQFPYRGQNDKELYSKIMAGELQVPEYVPPGPRSIIQRCMTVNAEERPTSAELWADPWLQNFNATCDSSLVSYSSRQSYSNRGGSNYLQKATTSPRYPGATGAAQPNKTSSKPFFSPNPRR
jgi:MAP/microtubule affinity-regulating kinase